MLFEGVKELIEHIFLALLAHLYIRVVLGVVSTLQVFNVDAAIAVCIELLEGHSYNSATTLVHLANNCAKELIVVNLAVSISVEKSEDDVDFIGILSDSIVTHGFGELLLVKSLRLVVVHNLEDSLNSVDASCSS